jgi:hypothetical protein
MAWKCIRTLTVVVMELLIHILEVQTNDLAPTYFSLSVVASGIFIPLNLRKFKNHCIHVLKMKLKVVNNYVFGHVVAFDLKLVFSKVLQSE